MKTKLLLSDEEYIEGIEYKEREKLFREFLELPDEFIYELRHFQPQIGCLNACKICSKKAEGRVACWNEKRIRNVVAALKYRALETNNKIPLIASGRKTHRPGIIFPYLDNDVASYMYLDRFIELLHRELGVKTRISTVGYSRHNKELDEVHKKVNVYSEGLGGVRLSFTPYGNGWKDSDCYSREEYIEDMANFLKVYRGYYDKKGVGYRKMCVEIRYSPLVVTSKVWVESICGYMIIATNNYLYISEDKNVNMRISKIKNPDNHFIELTQPPLFFYEVSIEEEIINKESLEKITEEFIIRKQNVKSLCEIYLMKNEGGIYFAINPKITKDGNYGINIYPCTEQRKVSGYIITERFFLNAMFEYKKKVGISSSSKFSMATWFDVYNVLDLCDKIAQSYKLEKKNEKSEYVKMVVIPMISGYVKALKKAGYSPADFFDPDFTIDTGIICNMGRAITEFKGISQQENEPLTPSHERNYGSENSLMVKEGKVWRISCGFKDTIVIQRLNLANTSKKEGQVTYQKVITLKNGDEELKNNILKTEYLIPGQKRR